MTPDSFTTQPLRPRDQLEAWREWYDPILNVLPKHRTGDEFRAEIHMWKLGGLAMSREAASCRRPEISASCSADFSDVTAPAHDRMAADQGKIRTARVWR